jgi:carbamoyl-phosphate synthase small subunit
MLKNFKSAKLILASGEVFSGFSPVWQDKNTFGEVVFNTGMTGYEETLTDPSYSGQILTFTYPILGNYGVGDRANWESTKIHVQGVVCETVYDNPTHYASIKTFLQWLEDENIPLITGVDTRELTRVIREHGVINGAIVFDNKKISKFGDVMETNWVKLVSRKEVEEYGSGKYKIVLVDGGAKQNIIRSLLHFDISLKIVPFDYDYSDETFDGVFLSNGPGDPKQCGDSVRILEKAMHKGKPIYGICLGSQLMGLAIGANTYKIKYGHRGQNQPCVEIDSGKCYLTSQNHGYAVDENTIPEDWVVSFRNLNDSTVAGIKHKFLPFASVQFHPEAAPGPHDSYCFFSQFVDAVRKVEGGVSIISDDYVAISNLDKHVV